MLLHQLLQRELTVCHLPITSKKRLFEAVSDLIHQNHADISAEQLFEKLIARERLGSTGIGHGIAIPHCRCSNLRTTMGCLIKLKEPIDFGSVDGQPVDILFVLLAPEKATDEHLETLAALAELLQHDDFVSNLRKSKNTDELFSIAMAQSNAA